MSHLKKFQRIIKGAVVMTDSLIYLLSFLLTFYLKYGSEHFVANFLVFQSALPFILFAFISLNHFSDIYVLHNKNFKDIFSLTLILQFLLVIFLFFLTFFGREEVWTRSILYTHFLVSTILLLIWRSMVVEVYLKYTGESRVMIIGPKKQCREVIRQLKSSKKSQYVIVTVAVDHYLHNIQKYIDEIDVFYLLELEDLEEEQKLFSYLTAKKKRILSSTDFGSVSKTSYFSMQIDKKSGLEVSKHKISSKQENLKRLIDIIFSFLLIVLTAPVMLVAAILIKMTSKGPVFYKQIRITKDQKEFKIIKFRSMRVDSEDISGPVFSKPNDPRVTKVGKYLRSLRIDELPQLLNVLKGEMSLVGPRPERPFFVEKFKQQNSYYSLRHNVRAGMTGYAQVYSKYGTAVNGKLKFDLMYINNYSLQLDFQILLQTAKMILDTLLSLGMKKSTLLNKLNKELKSFH